MDAGCLFVVATPIGNLEDITARAVRVLGEVALIAAEDTRHSRRLLNHLGISTRLTSYHEHNEIAKTETLIKRIQNGDSIAIITDAGTPCISDPGYRLVREARAQGIEVVSVPGPCAPIAALSVSGLPTDRFTFHGFFPRKKGQAALLLDSISESRGTHLFLESPNRLIRALEAVRDHVPNSTVCVARELTKRFEEVITGTPHEVCARFDGAPVKGECVLMVHVPKSTGVKTTPTPDELRRHVHEAMEQGQLSQRDAIRQVADKLSLPRKIVYRAATHAS